MKINKKRRKKERKERKNNKTKQTCEKQRHHNQPTYPSPNHELIQDFQIGINNPHLFERK